MADGWNVLERANPPVLEADKRSGTLDIVEVNYPEAEARRQASRCLRCNVNTVFDTVEVRRLQRLRRRVPGEPDPAGRPARGDSGCRPSSAKYAPEDLDEGAVMMKDESTCIRCAMCASRCPTHAILMQRFDFTRNASASPRPIPRSSTPGMSPLEFSLVFSLGLVSSLHCLQMCGPLVLSWSVSLPRQRALGAHLRYNAGRIATYMLLGAIAGCVRQSDRRAAGLRMATGARIVAGTAMIVSGILMLGLFRSNGLVTIQQPARFTRWIGRSLLGPDRKFQLGLMLGFLPCGLVYAALLKAVDAGNAVGGALTMLAFGLGTAVSLLALGLASSFTGFRLSRWSTKIAAVCIMAAGAVLL